MPREIKNRQDDDDREAGIHGTKRQNRAERLALRQPGIRLAAKSSPTIECTEQTSGVARAASVT